MENPDGLSWFIMVYHNGPAYLIEMTILGKKYREAHGLVPLCLLWCPSPACPRPRPGDSEYSPSWDEHVVSFRMDIV